MHVLSVSSVFIRMLQLLHLNVLKVYRVLHLPLDVSSSLSAALHPSLRLQRGPVEGVRRGMATLT